MTKFFWMLAGVAVLHMIFVLVAWSLHFSLIEDNRNETVIALVLWFLSNDAFGMFTLIFTVACFTVKRTWLKFLSYPAGVVLAASIVAGVSAPFGILVMLISLYIVIFHYHDLIRNED